jgi:hypothetical protein
LDASVLSEPFSTLAQQSGLVLVYDLSRLKVSYTLHGIGTRKSIVRERRDMVLRSMRTYLEGIHLFKTNKSLSLNTLKKVARLTDLSVMESIYEEIVSN